MELKEICTLSYAFESLQPFCIKASKTGTFSIMSKTSVQFLKPQFSFSMDLNRFNFLLDCIQCPQSCPTSQLDINEVEIYTRSEPAVKRELLLDQRYVPKLSNYLIQSRAIAWSPPSGERADCYLAYLSNYGGLEVFADTGDGNWKQCLNIGNKWFGHLVKDQTFPVKTFPELDDLVQDILITAMCWDENGSELSQRLLCVTKSNKFVLFSFVISEQIEDNQDTIIQQVVDINQKHVTALKWITLDGEKAWVVAGSLDGKVCLYDVDSQGGIELKTNLWDEMDQIGVGTIEYFNFQEKFVVVAAKGTHLLVFLVAKSDGSVISDSVQNIPGFSITGVTLLEPLSLLITSLDGSSSVIKITISTDNQVQILQETVSYTFNLSNHSLYGIATSPNLAYFIVAGFVTQTHDHLVLRQPANLFICRSTTVNPIQTLIANPFRNIHMMMDFAEAVRFIGGKSITDLRMLESQLDLNNAIGITPQYLSKLRAAVVVNAARYSYIRLRDNMQTKLCRKRAKALFQMMTFIRAHQILSQLIHVIPEIDTWNSNQKRVASSLLNFFQSFSSTTVDGYTLHDIELKMVAIATPLIESIQHKVCESWPVPEICTFCDQEIALDSVICAEGHQTPRCSITQLQFDTLDPVTCPHCKQGIFEDYELLKDVTLGNANLLTCPLCSVPLINVSS